MLSAKDFFYKKILQQDECHYNARAECIYQINSKNIRYSNSYEFGTLIERILKENESWLPKDLGEDIFVGKLKNEEALVFTKKRNDTLKGRLIVINVGYTLATMFVSECFMCFVNNDRFENPDFFRGINKVFEKWRRQDNFITLVDAAPFQREFDIKFTQTSMGITSLSEEFAVCHEIAHSLNGDTNFDIHNYVGEQFIAMNSELFSSETQHAEQKADMLAWLIMRGGPDKAMIGGNNSSIPVTIGGLIMASTVALLSEDPFVSNVKYPSPARRFDNMYNIISLDRKSLGDPLSRIMFSGEVNDPLIKKIEDFSPEEFKQKLEINSTVKQFSKDILDFHDLCYFYRIN